MCHLISRGMSQDGKIGSQNTNAVSLLVDSKYPVETLQRDSVFSSSKLQPDLDSLLVLHKRIRISGHAVIIG